MRAALTQALTLGLAFQCLSAISRPIAAKKNPSISPGLSLREVKPISSVSSLARACLIQLIAAAQACSPASKFRLPTVMQAYR